MQKTTFILSVINTLLITVLIIVVFLATWRIESQIDSLVKTAAEQNKKITFHSDYAKPAKNREPQNDVETAVKSTVVTGASFPDLKFTDINGKMVSVSNLKGSVVLIDFWATWCGPCIEKTPYLVAVYEEFHNRGFEIIGISLDSDRGELIRYLEKHQITWPTYFDGKRWNNEISSRFGINGVPTLILLDKNGVVRETDLRGDKIRSAVAELLGIQIKKNVDPNDWQEAYTIELKGVEDITTAPFGVTWFRPSGVKKISVEKPDFIHSLPPFKHEMQRYLTLQFGNAKDNQIFAVIDFRKPEKKFFPFDLYLDKNRDGNLAEDFIENSQRITGAQIPYNDGTTENYSLHLYSYFYGDEVEMAYRGMSGREGIFYAGQTPVRLLVMDYNSNGVFNDRKDMILMDWDLDGIIDGHHDAIPGAVALYSFLTLPGATYQVAECDPPGRRMILRRAAAAEQIEVDEVSEK